MASSEVVVDSGKLGGGRSKSNFSQTCSLLSQYLKENGSFGDLTLGLMTPKAEPKETKDLLPMIERSGCGEENCVKKTAPMTIFYAGQVIVLNDFPGDKAEEIMKLATKSSGAAAAAAKTQSGAAFAPPQAAAPVECAAKAPSIVAPQPALGSDLPIARKNSLARFLEKRKDRITANAPYQPPKPAAAAAANGDAWLGFSARFPLQIQRN